MKIEDKVIRSIANRRGNVILRAELKRFGSESHISRVVSAMVENGKLIRVGKGIFVKTKVSSISGNRIPAATLETVATEAFKKLKIRALPGVATEEYNSGKTNQLPRKLIIRTPHRKITRKLTVAGRTLEYEKDSA